MNPISITIGDRDFTKDLKADTTIADVEATFPVVDPIHNAFADMVRKQKYEVCEMAIGAFLQARDAGKPIVLLPVVVVGGFQHQNLYASPQSAISTVADLRGARVGVRSYSQTTGLWVRGWLEEEFGLPADAMKWLVTEGSHSESFQDPAHVQRLSGDLTESLYSGEVDAAILGKQSVPDLQPLVPDYEVRDRQWYERHGCAPINHMVAVTTQFADQHADAVREIYRRLSGGIAREVVANSNDLPPAVRFGTDRVQPAVVLAAEYAFHQGLISTPVSDIESLFCFEGRLD